MPDQKAVRHEEVEGLRRSADEHVDAQLVGLLGLDRRVGVVELAHPGPGQGEPAPEGPGDAAQPAALADGDVAAAQGGGGVT